MRWLTRFVVATLVAAAGWWLWQRVFVTDETRIQRLIAAMEQAVEAGNALRLEGAIASDYSDDYGLSKSGLLQAAVAFRKQYDAVLIHISDLTVTIEPDRQRAQAVLIAKILVTRAGNAETDARAERVRLHFRKTDDGWKLTRLESPELRFD
jgi:hypothetical protein